MTQIFPMLGLITLQLVMQICLAAEAEILSDGKLSETADCKPVVATASIKVSKLSTSSINSGVASGSQKEWEEEYDDWDDNDLDRSENYIDENQQKLKIEGTTENGTHVDLHEKHSGIELKLEMRKGENPEMAVKGFVSLYTLKDKVVPKLLSMVEMNLYFRI